MSLRRWVPTLKEKLGADKLETKNTKREVLTNKHGTSLFLSCCRACQLQLARKMVKGRQGERIRLYVRGTILGYKRSKSNQYPNTSLIQIEGVNTKEEVGWYAGKRMAYIYKAKVKKNGSHYRCIWGKVTRPHGNSGVVRAKFKSNLPPRSMGARIQVRSRSVEFTTSL
ncbi:unnamed protein product [Sphenostylis stenocarpa]|uniref:60S ribosomal protein L35a n=1 Tax=Sphenostylis stenocarpa TaxID=92480 RepID=A0AA86S634_9FABA|nr:unnamed protein product [Sphenostylis stenocarpa]